jgi:hypothetical protein
VKRHVWYVDKLQGRPQGGYERWEDGSHEVFEVSQVNPINENHESYVVPDTESTANKTLTL